MTNKHYHGISTFKKHTNSAILKNLCAFQHDREVKQHSILVAAKHDNKFSYLEDGGADSDILIEYWGMQVVKLNCTMYFRKHKRIYFRDKFAGLFTYFKRFLASRISFYHLKHDVK